MRSSIVLIAGAPVFLAGAATTPAHGDSKHDFNKGCESGRPPGSFVENAENVQCNTSGGTTITCDKSIKKCGVAAQAEPCTPAISHRVGHSGEILGLTCKLLKAAPATHGISDPI
jgi:hypothetical protein